MVVPPPPASPPSTRMVLPPEEGGRRGDASSSPSSSKQQEQGLLGGASGTTPTNGGLPLQPATVPAEVEAAAAADAAHADADADAPMTMTREELTLSADGPAAASAGAAERHSREKGKEDSGAEREGEEDKSPSPDAALEVDAALAAGAATSSATAVASASASVPAKLSTPAHSSKSRPASLAAALTAGSGQSASEQDCADDRCESCSKILRQCSASKMSLEERLQEILRVRTRPRHRDDSDPTLPALPPHHSARVHPSRHAPETSTHGGVVKVAIGVNATHFQRYSVLQQFVKSRSANDNRVHRDAIKGLLRLLPDKTRTQLSTETGVSLESVHLASSTTTKHQHKPHHEPVTSAKTSPETKHDNADKKESPAAAVATEDARGASQLPTKEPSHSHQDKYHQNDGSRTQQWMYLAQKALMEQSRRGSTRGGSDVNSTADSHDAAAKPTTEACVIPTVLREVDEEEKDRTASAQEEGESENPKAAKPVDPPPVPAPKERHQSHATGPIKKRKDPTPASSANSNALAMAKKKAKTAAAVLPPKPLTELQRLEKEARECHRHLLPPERENITLRSFALEYNEWSVLAVAKWVNQPPAATTSGNGANGGASASAPATPLEIPTSPTHYRKCNVCGKYGHFDVLCPRLSPTTGKALQAEMDELVQEASPAVEERHVTELCEGYAIEQCNMPFETVDSTGNPNLRRLPTQVCVTELDHMVIQAAPTAELLLDFA